MQVDALIINKFIVKHECKNVEQAEEVVAPTSSLHLHLVSAGKHKIAAELSLILAAHVLPRLPVHVAAREAEVYDAQARVRGLVKILNADCR